MQGRSRNEQDLTKAVPGLTEQDLSQCEIGRRLGASRARVGQTIRLRRLACLQDFIGRNAYPPTVREIVQGCNLSSTSVAGYNLLCLGGN